MDKTNILLTIGLGSVAGILIVNHFVSRSYAAVDDKKAADKKKMDMMKMMDKMVMIKAMAPKCTCPDGKTVQSIAVPGMMDTFSCPCTALTGALGQGITGQLGQGVTVIPQAAGVRGMQLQTVPNLMLMPGQVGGLLSGGTALAGFEFGDANGGMGGSATGGGIGGAGGAGGIGGMDGMDGTPGQPGQPGISFAAMDMDMEDMDLAMALKKAGIGDAEAKKVMMNAKKQKGAIDKVAKNTKCVCQDGTVVMAANGICNCAAVQAGGAVGLNRAIRANPQAISGIPGPTGLQGQVPMQGMRGMNRRGMRGMMQPGLGAIPMGGVSPSNTGQVCVLDANDNTFKLSGTNVMCDPGPGLTATRDPNLMAIGQSPQTLLSMKDETGASLVSLYSMAYLGDSTQGMNRGLPLIPQDSEDIYDEYGSMSYPYSHISDIVSPYDEESATVPFFITEPESYRAISLQPANYPRR